MIGCASVCQIGCKKNNLPVANCYLFAFYPEFRFSLRSAHSGLFILNRYQSSFVGEHANWCRVAKLSASDHLTLPTGRQALFLRILISSLFQPLLKERKNSLSG